MALQNSAKEIWQHEEFAALFEAASLLHGNWPKHARLDCIFVPGLAVDNWQHDAGDDGILDTAAELYHEANAGSGCAIAIPGYTATMPQGRAGAPSPTGYPGVEVWKLELGKLRVPLDAIVLYACDDVGPDGESWNTRTEVQDFVRLARECRWFSVAVLTTPFHLLRVLCTLVQALDEARFFPRFYPITPRSVSWTKAVYHSQGRERLPRVEHIRREWERIPRYQKDGSLCSFERLASYLRQCIGTRAR